MKIRFIRPIVAIGIVLLTAGILWIALNPTESSKSLRSSPPRRQITILEKTLSEHYSVFLSPEFYPLIPHAMGEQLPSLEQAKSATANAADFYRLNRERHFSLLFLGTHPLSAALARELLSSPLWVLTEVSPWGYLLTPSTSEKAPWTPPSPTTAVLSCTDPNQRAEFLIETAENLISIKKLTEAEILLKSAASLNHNLPSLQEAEASLAASQGRWHDALTLAREAFRHDSSSSPAAEILIRALTECGHPDEALEVARKLTQRVRNQETLFLLARAAYSSNSKNEEIEALNALIALGREHHQAIGSSLTYLGQAYARNGERGAAMRAFQEAITQPELTQEQRSLLRQLLDHLAPEGVDAPKN